MEPGLPDLSCTDLENVIIEKLPLVDHNNEVAEQVSRTAIRIRMPFRPEYIGQDIWQDSGHGSFTLSRRGSKLWHPPTV